MRRGEFWLEEACARRLGVYGRTYIGNDPFFFGRMRDTEACGLVTSQVECTAGIAYRRGEHVRSWTHDAHVIVLQRGQGATWTQKDRELKLARGDFLIANPDEPYSLASEGDFDFVSFYVPKSMLAEGLYPGSPDVARVVSASTPPGRVAAGFALHLAATMDQLDATSAAGLTQSLVRAVCVAAGAAAGEHQQTMQEVKFAQVLRYLEQHLGNPALTPASCAAANGLSLRALHLLFEPSGESFSQTLLRKRLLRSRALMERRDVQSITDIAFTCGFGSLATFYRAFKRSYGAAPGELQVQSQA